MQNEENKYDLIKFEDGEFSLDVRVEPKKDTVWLTQKEMSLLFDVSTDNIGLHINNIINEGELDDSTTEESSVVQIEGKRKVTRKIKVYNLDMIISVGYRVKSKRGILFRRWANSVLKEYLLKGYSINNERCLTHSTSIQNLTNEVNLLKNDLTNRITKLEEIIYGKNAEIIYEGEIVEPYIFLRKLFFLARKELIITDKYADEFLLSMLKDIKVKIVIIVSEASYLNHKDLPNNINIVHSNLIHDRYIIVDEMVYAVGSSINSLGKSRFAIIKLNNIKKEELLKGIK